MRRGNKLSKIRLGKMLEEARVKKNKTRSDMVEGGLNWKLVKDIEEGRSDYTVDSFIKYVNILFAKIFVK